MKEIDGTEYPDEVVEAFCKQPEHEFGPEYFDTKPKVKTHSWYWDLSVSHLASFYGGWKAAEHHHGVGGPVMNTPPEA